MRSETPIFSTLRNRPALASVVRSYARTLPDLARDLRGHAAAKDLERVRKLAHQLKGSSGGYGFAEIMGTAAAIETSAVERDVATVDRLVQTLLELCERASAGAELESVPA